MEYWNCSIASQGHDFYLNTYKGVQKHYPSAVGRFSHHNIVVVCVYDMKVQQLDGPDTR